MKPNVIIVNTKDLMQPRYNGTIPEVFNTLYPYSIQSGDTHLSSHKTLEEANTVLSNHLDNIDKLY